VPRPAGGQITDRERKRIEADLRQERYRRTRPLQDRIAKVERVIEEHEKEKAAIERTMADPVFYRDGEKVKKVTLRYKEVQDLLTAEYFRWGELTKELEKVSREISEKIENALNGGSR
jgi:ATP-binding cassette subfamily F protein 3